MAGQTGKRGTLILVVGPSGAGKDTLLDEARARLSADRHFVFPRRSITRPAEAGGEDHIALTRPDFDAKRAAGAFALSWEAHGLCYGIPAEIAADLAAGRHVVVNASRSILGEVAERFAPLGIVIVTAPPSLLARRLAERGREGEAAILERLSRAPAPATVPPGIASITLVNDRTIEEGTADFIAALKRLAGNRPGKTT